MSLEVIRERFEACHEANLKLVKKDSSGKFENNCASFFMAASVGNYTIDALHFV